MNGLMTIKILICNPMGNFIDIVSSFFDEWAKYDIKAIVENQHKSWDVLDAENTQREHGPPIHIDGLELIINDDK